MPRVDRCFVLDEDPLNLSDHLPIVADITCELSPPKGHDGENSIPCTNKPNWAKLSKEAIDEKYTERAEACLGSLPVPDVATLSGNPRLCSRWWYYLRLHVQKCYLELDVKR